MHAPLTPLPPHLPATATGIAASHHGAAGTDAPRPARSDGPCSDSTADGTTSPPRPPTPTGTAPTAAGSSSPTAPDSSARSGSSSTPGTLPNPASASGPGTRPPDGTAPRTTPPAPARSTPPPR